MPSQGQGGGDLEWGVSRSERYLFLVFGGLLVMCVSMGPYAALVLIPALSSVMMLHSLRAMTVHKLIFFTQMSWLSLCHLWLHYKDYYLQEPTDTKFLIALSSLMLLIQRVTSVSLDVHEGKVTIAKMQRHHSSSEFLRCLLPHISYVLYFPALLGGPLCSFQMFQIHMENLKKSQQKRNANSIWPFLKKCLLVFIMDRLRMFLTNCIRVIEGIDQGFLYCDVSKDILLISMIALMFRLAYYSQWLLSESLNNLVGLGFEGQAKKERCVCSALSDADIWTLETTNKISEFTRTWNKTTADWLRRMVFQRSKVHPLLATFAFSAWWHGLHPGQVFGFVLWACSVKADYYVHHYIMPLTKKSRLLLIVYKVFTWIQTRLITAYILIAVELRTLAYVLMMCRSACILSPVMYMLVLVAMYIVSQHH
eukprot:gi/632949576/ref/XP_007890232.1/ PREDICTED: ghrelin O-acyltransferase [Callorhinchus milii]